MLEAEVKTLLGELYETAQRSICQQGERAWAEMRALIKPSLYQVNFKQLLVEFAAAESYHRIPYHSAESDLSVVLFVFKRDLGEQGAVLVHFYSNQLPNDTLFDWSQVVNKPAQFPHIRRTLPHNHRAKCYSYVAYVSEGVKVTEENYRNMNGSLKLISERARLPRSFSYDDTRQNIIHSISVHFP